MSALVEVKDICKIYNPGENEVRALDHVSLSIEKGEFVAIIGQSGSGKSTLMNMLGCLDVPTSGKYYLNGRDVSTLTDDEQSDIRNREIGFIFQGFNLISNLTAQENVELPLIYRGVPRKERNRLAVESLKIREILQILKELYKGGRTVILITHDNGIAAQAKRVIRILDGRIESDTMNPDVIF